MNIQEAKKQFDSAREAFDDLNSRSKTLEERKGSIQSEIENAEVDLQQSKKAHEELLAEFMQGAIDGEKVEAATKKVERITKKLSQLREYLKVAESSNLGNEIMGAKSKTEKLKFNLADTVSKELIAQHSRKIMPKLLEAFGLLWSALPSGSVLDWDSFVADIFQQPENAEIEPAIAKARNKYSDLIE